MEANVESDTSVPQDTEIQYYYGSRLKSYGL
jgi:hypothetical protein